MRFSTILESALQNKDRQQKELAEHLEVHASNISQYATGRTEPDFETMMKICQFLNIDLTAIYQIQHENPDAYIILDKKRHSLTPIVPCRKNYKQHCGTLQKQWKNKPAGALKNLQIDMSDPCGNRYFACHTESSCSKCKQDCQHCDRKYNFFLQHTINSFLFDLYL